ncbi:MAG: helix-turn-helix domain-containing protein [Acutalibacteraceae bacterium]
MADRQRGGIEFSYKDGFFRDASEWEPLQLYQVIEREQDAGIAPLPMPIFSNSYILLYCACGKGTARIGEHEVPLCEGTIVYCKNGTCSIETDAASRHLRYTCLYLGISNPKDSYMLSPLYSYYREDVPLHMAQDTYDMTAFFALLIAELCSAHPTAVLVRDILNQIMITAYRNFVRRRLPEMTVEPTANAVGHTTYAIIRYVDEHLYSMNNLMDMAKDLGYSYNYLSHLFRRKTGMTIQAYVSHKKIEKSLELLEDSTLSVTEIASALNYDCIQSFSKAFKRAMHMSPTEYRAGLGRTAK